MFNQLKKGKGRMQRLGRQNGATLIEMLISIALSLIVISSMVVLMSNSMGTATRITQMAQLTDELRNTMSMLTRDVRRANYNPYSIYCYSNSDCGVSDTTLKSNFIGDLEPAPNAGNSSCLVYFIEREAPDGDPGVVGGGGFRRVTTAGGVGIIEMWTGDTAPPSGCTNSASWIAVTDPDLVNITELTINRDDGSFENELKREDGSVLLTQRVRQVNIQIQGELLIDSTITKRLQDVIRVRNDFIQSS